MNQEFYDGFLKHAVLALDPKAITSASLLERINTAFREWAKKSINYNVHHKLHRMEALATPSLSRTMSKSMKASASRSPLRTMPKKSREKLHDLIWNKYPYQSVEPNFSGVDIFQPKGPDFLKDLDFKYWRGYDSVFKGWLERRGRPYNPNVDFVEQVKDYWTPKFDRAAERILKHHTAVLRGEKKLPKEKSLLQKYLEA